MTIVDGFVKRLLPKSTFGRGVITLLTGTGLAQALPIALSPILTRLYTPEEFGVFAFYMSVVAILVIFVTGKYEIAIVIARSEAEAVNLVAATVMLSLVGSLILLGIVLMWGAEILALVSSADMGSWLYLVPLTTMIIGVYNALNFWANRRTRYTAMAVSRVVQSGVGSAVQLTAGASKSGVLGLIMGQISGQLISMLFLLRSLPQGERNLIRRVSAKRVWHVARKHIDYPKYMAPSQLISVLATELPLLLLTVFFGAGIAGLYSLAQRVTAAPLSLIGGAIGDVYRQQASEQYGRTGNCLALFVASFKRLLLFGVVPALPILLFGPQIFGFVFGATWRAAGEIASILAVLVFFQTVSSPLSTTVLLPGWLRIEFFWQAARLLLAGTVFYSCGHANLGYGITIAAHVTVFSSLYVVHSFLQLRAAQGGTIPTVRS